MPIPTGLEIKPGARVAYEDRANPRREGRVAEVINLNGETPNGLPLPGGVEYRVVWDDGYRFGDVTETTSDLRQHGWELLADLPGSVFDGAPIISAYTRAQAIADGTLVPLEDLVPDEPGFASSAGFVAPIALTSRVANLVIPTDVEERDLQDVKGRLWDVLTMARVVGRRVAAGGPFARFPVSFRLGGRPEYLHGRRGQKTIMLAIEAGPDDYGELALTIMFPDER